MRTGDSSRSLPVILLVDGQEGDFRLLLRCLEHYHEGRLLSEFRFEHVDSHAALKNWYQHNRSRFVSLIIQGLDYSHVRDERKLLDSRDIKYPIPRNLDPKTFQGLLIYASLRHTTDRITPVVFVASPTQLAGAQRFTNFIVYPGHGSCTFMPGPLNEQPRCIELAERIDNLALRQTTPETRREWQERHEMVIGQSRRMASLVHEIRRGGPSDAIVLLLGRPGVGKELVANALHRLSYRYSAKPPARRLPHAVNIPALDHSLLEDDLFGHERGAFTGAVAERKGIFEVARGSTVFLDEIGDVSHETQLKLLRAMEYHRIKRLGSSDEIVVDMRIIAATNRAVSELQTRFRTDFYTRLVQSCIMVPSLKERWEEEPAGLVMQDVEELAQFVVDQMNRNPRHTRKLSIDTGAIRFLHELVWGFIEGTNTVFQGNIRTLRNIVERAYERAQFEGTPMIRAGQVISTIGLIQFLNTQNPGRQDVTVEEVVGSLNLDEIERRAITEALKKCDGNQSKAAEVLGMHRDTLRRKILEYKL